MSMTLLAPPPVVLDEEALRIEASLVTDTDDPVDDTFSEQMQRLLPQALYSSWNPPASPGCPGRRKFWAAADVGIYRVMEEPPLVPDTFISLDVERPANRKGAYFCWRLGKMPEEVVEVVSNREGNELGRKLRAYASWGIEYYVVFDPDHEISTETLQVFVLEGGEYRSLDIPYLPRLGLGLVLWKGEFEGTSGTFLRWCDETGALLLTGDERNAETLARAEEADSRAKESAARAAAALSECERLSAKLRALGIDPG